MAHEPLVSPMSPPHSLARSVQVRCEVCVLRGGGCSVLRGRWAWVWVYLNMYVKCKSADDGSMQPSLQVAQSKYGVFLDSVFGDGPRLSIHRQADRPSLNTLAGVQ